MTEAPEPGTNAHRPLGTIELWHARDRLWRYRYLHPAGTVIRSNRGFLTPEEAIQSAVIAYPGVPAVEVAESPYAGPRSRPWRKLAVVSAVTAAVGVVVMWAAKAVLSVRRVARRTKQVGRWIRVIGEALPRNR